MAKLWRTYFRTLALVLLGAAFLGFLHGAPGHAEPDLSRSKPSEKALYTVTIAPESGEPAIGALHSWLLTLTLPDGAPVNGASIAVDGGMPQHNHGLPTEPKMTAELGEGRYRIEGVKFNMGGNWVFSFDISAPAGDDKVVFNLAL